MRQFTTDHTGYFFTTSNFSLTHTFRKMNSVNQVLGACLIFKNIYLTEFSTDWPTNCLMPSDQSCSITAKAMGLLLFISPRDAIQHIVVHTVHSLWTYQCLSLCPIHTAKIVDLTVAHDGFLL